MKSTLWLQHRGSLILVASPSTSLRHCKEEEWSILDEATAGHHHPASWVANFNTYLMPWGKVITANSTFIVTATLLKPQKVVSCGKVQHVSSDTCPWYLTFCIRRRQGGSWREVTGCKHRHFEGFLELQRKPHLRVWHLWSTEATPAGETPPYWNNKTPLQQIQTHSNPKPWKSHNSH